MLNGKIIKIVAAYAKAPDGRLVIGNKGELPWPGLVPSDMKRFVTLTTYHSVIMGRKTWDSLPISFRPLKNRQNIILTRHTGFVVYRLEALNSNTEVIVARSLEEALQVAKSENIWIIGGAEIYAMAMLYADYLHLTEIRRQFEGDAFFPPIDWDQWRKIGEEYCSAGVSGTEKKKDQIDSTYYAFQRIW